METRRLGKTGQESTVVTFGTYAIGVVGQEEAARAIEFALERGINHFDVAPTYADAEERLGSYLKRHPQPDVFIGCKTEQRTKAGRGRNSSGRWSSSDGISSTCTSCTPSARWKIWKRASRRVAP